MLKKITQKIKNYRDKRFLKRLERVLRNYPVNTHLIVKGSIYGGNSFYMQSDKIIEDFENRVADNFIETEYQKQNPKANIKL